MIPNLPILNKSKYKSGVTQASYNPLTLLTKLPEPDTNSDSERDFMIQMFEYNATTIHERVHWFQHHGTSFGCFLEALRLSQMMTTLRSLREIPLSEIRDLLHQRHQSSQPIIAIDREEQYPVFNNEGDSSYEMNLFRQIWFDHQWVHQVLDDSTVLQSGMKQIPESAFGEVVGDVMLALCGELNFSPQTKNTVLTNPFEPRKWFSIAENEMVFASWKGLHLTSRLLMECSATISEIRVLLGNSWIFTKLNEKSDLKAALRSRIKRILEGDYGLPIRIILQILKVDLANLEVLFDILPTVNVLCFIALNPPLPPYVMYPPQDALSWQWQDIYPPIRFLRLTQYISKIGLLKNFQDHRTISAYIDELCDICQITHTINLDYPDFKPRNNLDFSDVNTVSSHTGGILRDDYVFWVQSQMTNYRLNSLPFMVSLGDCMFGDLSVKNLQEIIYQGTDIVPFSYSPFAWTKDNKLGFSCPLDFGNLLFRGIAIDYVTFDLVVGTSSYDLADFPDEISQNEEFYKFLERNITHNFTQIRNL